MDCFRNEGGGRVWIMRTRQAACFSRYSKRAFTDLSARWRFAVVEFPDILVRASADELQPLVRGQLPGAVFLGLLLPPPNPCLLNLPLFGLSLGWLSGHRPPNQRDKLFFDFRKYLDKHHDRWTYSFQGK